ncbi:hypothetical protein ACH4E7_23920 [Kitasatospora sp. NPDC018058]|uniref:hypothetical protein n=1 Tax=Kitasatospora sp. NPDC018058 TaxID=3364025 RepID=UPI0037BFCF0E
MKSPEPAKLHGYGVLWDTGAQCYRVRNEMTREWLRTAATGELAAFSSFDAAWGAWKVFEVHKRPGEQ